MDFLFIPFFIVLFISLVAGFVASKKEHDFFLASRKIRWPLLVGTFVGTQIGGGFILGNTDSVCVNGLPGAMYGIGLAFGMIALGFGFSERLRLSSVGTLPELLERKYGSVCLKRVAALIAVSALTGILMSQAIGLEQFLRSLGCETDTVFHISWGAVVLYTACGGLLAVVWTDLVQASIMLGMLLLIFGLAILPKWEMIVAHAGKMPCEWSGGSFALILFPLCYMFVTQDMAQRCFSARSPRDARKGCVGAALIFLLFSIIPTACGMLGSALGLDPNNGSIFMQVIQMSSTPWIFICTASIVLLAIVSTASSILLALSANVANDLPISAARGRIVTFLLGALAIIGPWFGHDIIQWIVTSNKIAVGLLFFPIVIAVITKRERLPLQAAWGSIIFGTAALVLDCCVDLRIFGNLLILGFSLLGYGLGWMFASRTAVQCEVC